MTLQEQFEKETAFDTSKPFYELPYIEWLENKVTQERENRKRDLKDVLEYFENNIDEDFRKHLKSKLSELNKG